MHIFLSRQSLFQILQKYKIWIKNNYKMEPTRKASHSKINLMNKK
jgi:hypothetical protein